MLLTGAHLTLFCLISISRRGLRLLAPLALFAVLVPVLSGCDRRSDPSTGSGSAAGSAQTRSASGSDAGTTGSGVDLRTPTAPDTRNGGSSGSVGVVPVPDTSGAPSSGSRSPGASQAPAQCGTVPVPGASSTAGVDSNAAGAISGKSAPALTSNKGLAASELGRAAGAGGNTNSSPASNTGGPAR